MTLPGWLILISSVGAVTGVFGWCIFKILTSPSEADSGSCGEVADDLSNQ